MFNLFVYYELGFALKFNHVRSWVRLLLLSICTTGFGADGCADDGCASKKNQLGATAARTGVVRA